MNDGEIQEEIGGGQAIHEDRIGPLPLRSWFQYHLILMSSIRTSGLLSKSIHRVLVRILEHKILDVKTFNI